MDEIPTSKIISIIRTEQSALKVVFPFEFCQIDNSENVHIIFWRSHSYSLITMITDII